MKGHDEIIQMRMSGKKPAYIHIDDYPCQTGFTNVCTHGDTIERIDMRFVVGLTVFIVSESEERAKAIFKKAISSGADVVLAMHSIPDVPEWESIGWSDSWRRNANP